MCVCYREKASICILGLHSNGRSTNITYVAPLISFKIIVNPSTHGGSKEKNNNDLLLKDETLKSYKAYLKRTNFRVYLFSRGKKKSYFASTYFRE